MLSTCARAAVPGGYGEGMHVCIPSPYLGNGWTDCTEIWCVVRGPMAMRFTQDGRFCTSASVTIIHLSASVHSRSFIAQKASYWFMHLYLIPQWLILLRYFRFCIQFRNGRTSRPIVSPPLSATSRFFPMRAEGGGPRSFGRRSIRNLVSRMCPVCALGETEPNKDGRPLPTRRRDETFYGDDR